jgi:hypothetical protein
LWNWRLIGGSRHEADNHSTIPDRSRIVKKSQATAEEYSIHEYELSNHLNSCFNSYAPVCAFQTGAFLLLGRDIMPQCRSPPSPFRPNPSQKSERRKIKMEITIKINGRMVSVEVSDEVTRADGKPRTFPTKSGGTGMGANLTST